MNESWQLFWLGFAIGCILIFVVYTISLNIATS